MSELSVSPPRSPRSPRSVGSRSVTISLDSPKASHTVKLSLPASMDAEPVARVAEHFAKSYNEAHPGEPPIKPNRLRLSSDADRRLVDLKSPVGAAVKDGSAYTFSEQEIEQQASPQEQTPPPLPPRELPFPRRCRVVGRGLVLRASPETIADRLAEFPFGAEVVVRVRTTQKTRLALSLDPKHILSVSFPAMSDYTQIRPVGNVPVWPNTTTMLGDLPMKLFKALTGIAGAIALTTGSAFADDLRWKMPVAFATNLPGLGSPAAWVADNLNTASDGSIQVRVYEPGKLVPPFDILQSVSDGKVSAGYTWIGYDQGKVPAIPLFAAVPFGMKPPAYIGWYYFGGGHEMLQETYANKGFDVHAQLCGIIGPETAGWYSDPIETLEDYKGLKIRFAGLGGKVLEKLGASVTMMPGGELYQALEKGTIDATEFSMPAIDQILGFNQVVKYNLFPGWHQQFTAQYMLINKDEWARATDAQKALVEASCTAATTRGLAEGEYKNGKVLAEFQDKGVQADQIPRDVLLKLKEVTQEVLEEEASKDADFKRVYESQQEFMESYKVWDTRAYVPADL